MEIKKRLLKKLQPFIKQNHSLLSRRLAALWLQKYLGRPLASQTLSSHFTSRPAAHPDPLAHILEEFPVNMEGTPAQITPELMAWLDEVFLKQPRKLGIFYTPYPLAQLLARETLNTWLQKQGYALNQLPMINSKQALALDRLLSNLTVCDPCVGTGGLLVPFWLELAQLRARLSATHKQSKLLSFIAQHNLYAADLRPKALEHLRLRMLLTLGAWGELSLKNLLPHCFVGDALSGTAQQSVWQHHFPHIFQQGGFDIILANPPYIGQKYNHTLFANLRTQKHWQDKLVPKGDLLYLFFYLGLELVREEGLLGFITTSYFTHATSAIALRKTLQQETSCWRLIDFEDQKMFGNAPGQHTLLSVFEQTHDKKNCCTCGLPPGIQHLSQDRLYEGTESVLQTRPINANIQHILKKMESAPFRLGSVSHISNGLMTGCDKITKRHLSQHLLPGVQTGEGVFILTRQEKEALSLNNAEKKKLKPFYKNSDIGAYRAKQTPDLFLIDFFYPNDRNTDFSKYPNLMNHLARFKPVLLARKQNNNGIDKQLIRGHYWFGSVRRKMNFESAKLVIPQRSLTNTVAYAPGPWYASSDVYFITAPQPPFSLWFLLGLLNTSPYYMWLAYRGKRKGKLLELYTSPLSQIPVPNASPEEIAVIEELAQAQYRHYTHARQEQLNRQVARLFQLSAEEKAVLEPFIKKQTDQ